MAPSNSISSYFQPIQSTKRKAVEDTEAEKENSPKAARKRARSEEETLEEILGLPPYGEDVLSSKKTTKPKVSKSKASTTSKPVKAKPKAAPTPKKLFNDTVKLVAKQVEALDKEVKSMDGNTRDVSIADYAEIAVDHLSVVETLAASDPILAFNLALCLGDAACTNLNITCKMCGYGDHEHPFAELDAVLLPLIEGRSLPSFKVATLPEVAHRWSHADADVGEFKTGRPNKQQRNQMANDRIDWDHDRRAERVKRRDECEDWVSVALADLKSERDYLDAYGVYGFFKKSITMLEELDEARR